MKMTGLLWRLAASVSLVVGVAVAAAGSQAAMAEREFCSSPTIRNYEAGFDRLPPVQALPPSGRTPFSPTGVRIDELRLPGQRVLPIGDRLAGVQIENRSDAEVSLNWRVTSRLVRIGAGGTGVISEAFMNIGSLQAKRAIRIPGGMVTKPGIVRQDLEFESSTGQRLGAYAEYFRVVKPIHGVRMGLLPKTARRPGTTVLSRVENIGPVPVGYGRTRLERLTKRGWQALPGDGVGFSSRLAALPGTAGRCQRTRIPVSAPEGRYRLSQIVVRIRGSSAKRQTIKAPFAVISEKPK
jgi:hypothetical protein